MDFLTSRKNKRQKMFLATIGIVFGILILALVPANFISFAYLVVGIWIMACVWWGIEITTNRNRIFALSIPLMAVGYVFDQLNTGEGLGIIAIFGLVFAIYGLLLVGNVLYISLEQLIPLRKVALSLMFFMGIGLNLIYAYKISLLGWHLDINLIGYWIATVVYGFAYLSWYQMRIWIELVILGLLSLQIIVISVFWPAEQPILAATVTGLVFIVMATLQHHLERNLTVKVYREMAMISAVLLLAYFFL